MKLFIAYAANTGSIIIGYFLAAERQHVLDFCNTLPQYHGVDESGEPTTGHVAEITVHMVDGDMIRSSLNASVRIKHLQETLITAAKELEQLRAAQQHLLDRSVMDKLLPDLGF